MTDCPVARLRRALGTGDGSPVLEDARTAVREMLATLPPAESAVLERLLHHYASAAEALGENASAAAIIALGRERLSKPH